MRLSLFLHFYSFMSDDKTSSPYLELFLFQSAFSISSSLPSEGKLLLSLSISFPFNSLSSLFLYFPSSVFLPLAHLLILLICPHLFPQFHHPFSLSSSKGTLDRRLDHDLSSCFLFPYSSIFTFLRKFLSSPPLLPVPPFTAGQRPFFSVTVSRNSQILLITSLSVRHLCSPFHLVM